MSHFQNKTAIVTSGIGLGIAPLEAVTEEHFNGSFSSNVRGALFTVQKALPLLNDNASVILIGSIAADSGTAGFSIYAASKAAVRSFARNLGQRAKEAWDPRQCHLPGCHQGTHVCGPLRGGVPKYGGLGSPRTSARGRRHFRAGYFLAGPDSSFSTGVNFYVDGGQGQI